MKKQCKRCFFIRSKLLYYQPVFRNSWSIRNMFSQIPNLQISCFLLKYVRSWRIKNKSLKFRLYFKFSTDRHSNRKCRDQIQPALPLLRPFTQSLTVGHQNIRPQSSISMLQGWTGLFLWTAQKNAKLEKPATDLQS